MAIRALGLASGRVQVVLAALLWSTSGAFVKNIQLPGTTIALYRALAAGLVLLGFCLVARIPRRWQPSMAGMALCFGAMNYTFIESMTLTTAANTIFLQYTAPLWVFGASVLILKEPVARRNVLALAGGMVGVGVLIAGEWGSGHRHGLVLGLASGVSYAGVAVFLRLLRDENPVWLSAVNLLSAALVLAGTMALASALGRADPSWFRPASAAEPLGAHLGYLILFGVVQMAIPYVLFASGLRTVKAQEAAVLTLLEPLLNPLWTYWTAGEQPSLATLAGGAVLLTVLLTRYVLTPTE